MLTEETAKALIESMNSLTEAITKADLPQLAFQLDIFDPFAFEDAADKINDAADKFSDAIQNMPGLE